MSISAASLSDPDVGSTFQRVGGDEARARTPLTELISASFSSSERYGHRPRTHGVGESAMDLQRPVDLNRALGRFFDRASIRHSGYTECRCLRGMSFSASPLATGLADHVFTPLGCRAFDSAVPTAISAAPSRPAWSLCPVQLAIFSTWLGVNASQRQSPSKQ